MLASDVSRVVSGVVGVVQLRVEKSAGIQCDQSGNTGVSAQWTLSQHTPLQCCREWDCSQWNAADQMSVALILQCCGVNHGEHSV